jgi:hypothetical protein
MPELVKVKELLKYLNPNASSLKLEEICANAALNNNTPLEVIETLLLCKTDNRKEKGRIKK